MAFKLRHRWNSFRSIEWAGLMVIGLIAIGSGCTLLQLEPADQPRGQGGGRISGIRMTIYSRPDELTGVDFTVFNPDAEVIIEEQRPGWNRIVMEVFVHELDARDLMLHGMETVVMNQEGELQHIRLRGWIPADMLSLPAAGAVEPEIRLEVIEWAWHRVTGGIMIDGVVKNNGEETVHNAEITVSATDETGNQLTPRTVRLQPEIIEPGETAHFMVRLDAFSDPTRIYARFKLNVGQ